MLRPTTTEPNDAKSRQPSLPTISPWLLDGFSRFCVYYLRRSFHALAVDARNLPNDLLADGRPMIVYANHPSWWDPIVAILLHRQFFGSHKMYAPIAAEMLQNYKIFAKLGFFGIQQNTLEGARDFLKTSSNILSHKNSALWLTPEGRFADVRDHSAALMPGLAHLASKTPGIAMVPLALEYSFWEESKPEALAKFGPPLFTDQHPQWSKSDWANELASSLRQTQIGLADISRDRLTDQLDVMFSSRTGTWVGYDMWRWAWGRLRGKPISISHGKKLNS